MVNRDPSSIFFDRKHEKRHSTNLKIRDACMRRALETPEREIDLFEMRRLATELCGRADPQTVERHLQTLFDIQDFELVGDGRTARIVRVPIELAYGAISPRSKKDEIAQETEG